MPDDDAVATPDEAAGQVVEVQLAQIEKSLQRPEGHLGVVGDAAPQSGWVVVVVADGAELRLPPLGHRLHPRKTLASC
jgi:hypothetical protein